MKKDVKSLKDLSKASNKFSKERTFLSKERTLWANERTTLAYIRTGFAAFLLGVGLIKFFESSREIYFVGIISLLIGFLLILSGVIYYPLRRKVIVSHE